MRKPLAVLISVAVFASACTSYHASGATGGFHEMQLSATTYEVRFRGNGYTSPDRVTKFVLRRAAELTLEHGHRYFVLGEEKNLDRHDMLMNYTERAAVVRLVGPESPDAADAVIVIQETNDVAGGRLSERASAHLRTLM